MAVNYYAIDFTAGDKLSGIVDRLHLERQESPIDRRWRLGSDLYVAAYVGSAPVLDSHRGPNGRLPRIDEGRS